MATTAVSYPVPPASKRRLDRIFFPFVSLLVLAVVLIGFARTYFLAGMVRAPLPDVLIHIHGAAFTSWVLLVIVQTALIGTRNVRLHKTLGLFGFGLALAMVVLGVSAATDMLKRGFAPPGFGPDAATFYATPMVSMLLFSVLVFFAYRTRFQPAAHKRYITVATLSLLDAAIARWPFAFMNPRPLVPDLIYFAPLLLMVLYDLLIFRRVLRATWASVLFVAVVHLAETPVGMTPPWHMFAHGMARL